MTAWDQEMHSRYPVGSTVEADLHQAKSGDLLKLYWGFLGFVVDATGRFGNARSLSNALLTEAGYVESFTELRGGGVHAHPMSIADMQAQDFKQFCENAFATIYEEFGIEIDHYKAHLRGRQF